MNDATYITIVSGLPRSGTSMMMRMLEQGGMGVVVDNVRDADEDNPNGYYEFESVKKTREDASWLTEASGKAVKMVYQLLYDLPADDCYRVLFMRRDLDEVLASQRTMLDRNQSSDDAVNDEQMAALFKSQLAKFEQWISEQANFAVLEVSYNDLLRDPAPVVDRVNRFLGKTLDTDAMIGVIDSALYRNRS